MSGRYILRGYREYKIKHNNVRKIVAKGLIVVWGLSVVLMFWR